MATPETGSAAALIDNPDAGHQSGVFPPFDVHNFVPQLIWLVIIFGALYWLMSRVALPRVQGILDARRTRIAQDLDNARTMQDQAEAAERSYDTTLAEAKVRAQGLAQETHDKLNAASEARRHALEDELNGRLAAAETQIADMKTRAMSNVGAIAREAAANIIQHITGVAPGEQALIDAAAATQAH